MSIRNILAIGFTAILLSISTAFIGCHSIETPKWDECTKSSNWHGANASQRMMNVLSPHMPDTVFSVRVNFMKSRGCNTAHVILCNKADGEYAGYSIYGNGITWTINKAFTDVMTKRIKKLHNEGFGIVIWLMTDDGNDWAKALAGNAQKYIDDIDSLGWFKYASTVCVGLELDEYFNANQVNAFVVALRSKYKGKIATHHTSGKATFAALGDILFYQVNPTDNQSTIKNACSTALKSGKPVNMFETYRQENRRNCETAFANGCYAVGNW